MITMASVDYLDCYGKNGHRRKYSTLYVINKSSQNLLFLEIFSVFERIFHGYGILGRN